MILIGAIVRAIVRAAVADVVVIVAARVLASKVFFLLALKLLYELYYVKLERQTRGTAGRSTSTGKCLLWLRLLLLLLLILDQQPMILPFVIVNLASVIG